MNRARIVFIAIVGLAICGIFSAVVFDLISNREPTSVTDTQATPLPTDALPILIASSNTKEDWLNTVADQFNNENHQTSDGQRIVVQVEHVTSGGSMNAILDGTLQPVAWSPGDGSWAAQANSTWQQRHNKPIASQACTPTIYAPLGFAMWRPMAEALGWPQEPIGWDTIVDLAANPDGWGAYGRPEWGQFTFGHTHPAYANSGLLSMTGFVYGVSDVPSESLTASDVYAENVTESMQKLEQNTAKYGRQAPALLELMAQNGTSYLHAAAVPEAEVVRFNTTRADELEFPLAFIFPSAGTIWADHPYCILDNADWVDATEAEAGQLFLDYLLEADQQSLAIDNYLRPLDSNIALHAPMSLENGTDPSVTVEKVPAFPSPSAEISEAIIDQFFLTKRKATIIVVLDVSGSMNGDKIKTARTATADFLNRLHPDDEVAVFTFSDETVILSEPARVGDVVETLSGRVSTITTNGNTSLFDAVCQATAMAEFLQSEDVENGESRLYGVVLLSDGEDTVGQPSAGQMFAACLPNNAEADGVKIFPIAFGDGADTNTLERIASVTGGRMFTADPDSITRAYEFISAEQ